MGSGHGSRARTALNLRAKPKLQLRQYRSKPGLTLGWMVGTVGPSLSFDSVTK